MEHLPLWIPVLFILTTVLTVFLFFKSAHFNKIFLIVSLGWLLLQAAITLSGFYQATSGMPPRFALALFPPLVLIILLFLTAQGRSFLNRLDAGTLTFLHVVRIPVEVVLYGLFLHRAIPIVMTFEGRNFDILSGLTAPLVWYFGYRKNWLGKWVLLSWNLICLALLGNIVVTAIFSAPFPFQRFGFQQPNIAMLYFPYSWLAALIVPVVLLAHLVVIRQLLFLIRKAFKG